jgi:methyl-accepting chemotaxis protein
MDDVVQQNAALVEEAAAAAQAMQEQVNSLNEVVGIFRTDAGATAGARRPLVTIKGPSPAPRLAHSAPLRASAKPAARARAAAPAAAEWEQF